MREGLGDLPQIIDPAGYLADAQMMILPFGSNGHQAGEPVDVASLRVGVDLGTAYTVLVVLDGRGKVVAGEYAFAEVVRDGLVVDYIGAVDLLREMKKHVETRLGCELTHAASGYPPGVPRAEIRATANVVEAAGMNCEVLVDEPTAANNVLHLRNGAIVDVGGGTTGIAVLKDGKVVRTSDEPTGGTHFSLVIAGALGLSFEQAESLKKEPEQYQRLYPLVRPVMEKVGVIVERTLRGMEVERIVVVGGTTLFPGLPKVVEEITGIPTHSPQHPMFVTPLGIALSDTQGL